jgi:RHS repeat-associated protein
VKSGTATFGWEGVDQPLSITVADTPERAIHFYELDLAGNVRRLRGQGGEDRGGYRYTAFGKLFPATTATPAPAGLSANNFLKWKARPRLGGAGGDEIYDMRARLWSPDLGVFLSIDEFPFHDRRSTLWGWPGQNPLKWSDPSGRYGLDSNFDHDFVNPPRNGPIPTNEKIVGAAMAAPFVAVGGLYALAELGGWFGGTTLGRFLGLGGTGAIGQKLNSGGCALPPERIAALRPIGEQRDLINQLFKNGVNDPRLTSDTLRNYAELARNAMQDPAKATPRALEEQSRRLGIIEELLRARGE